MGRGKAWRVGVCLAAGLSWPVWGAEARARLEVSARVVHGAQVEAPLPLEPDASRRVPGGMEWRVEIAGPAAQVELVGACPGVRLRERGERSGRSLWVFIPEGSRCTPMLRETVFPDATP